MTIPEDSCKDILEDLMALYAAGEASVGTKRLVEAYAREHPEIAERLKAAAGLGVPLPPVAVDPDVGVRTLKQTRQFITLRTLFSAMGIAFTLLPLTFTFDQNGVRLFLHDQTGLVSSFWSVAAASWVATWMMHREIRRTGI